MVMLHTKNSDSLDHGLTDMQRIKLIKERGGRDVNVVAHVDKLFWSKR